jgi:hypothetical protein
MHHELVFEALGLAEAGLADERSAAQPVPLGGDGDDDEFDPGSYGGCPGGNKLPIAPILTKVLDARGRNLCSVLSIPA